jgi:alpha-ribazole phosphatase
LKLVKGVIVMKENMRLWLVRHGQTEWNNAGFCLGHTDLPLNRLGRESAHKLQRQIDLDLCETVYCSPKARAIETAKIIIGSYHVPLEIERDLCEMDFGHWEGESWDAIHTKWIYEWDRWMKDPLYSAPYGGESLDEVSRRMAHFYRRLLHEHKEKTVLLVGHGGSLNIFLCGLFQVPLSVLWTFRLSPGSFSEVVIYPHGPILTILNQVPLTITKDHLSPVFGNYEKVESILQTI